MLKKNFLIAEISSNHCGSFQIAKRLITCAKKNGADAVKLQTYTADTMTFNSKKNYFKIKHGLWKGKYLWDLYKSAHTPLDWHPKLFQYGKKIGIPVFSTPYDETAVDFLEKINCPIYKVASFEMTDLSLIKRISLTKKPIIISTGMASLDEIKNSYNFARKVGIKDITLLYCVSNYPSKIEDFNLHNIKIMKKQFDCRIGFSDHSKDNSIVAAAIAMGAEIVEKHIALDNQKKGLDVSFSLKGKEIKKYKNCMNKTFNILGKETFIRKKGEIENKVFRRSIFISSDIKKGEKFSKSNLRRIRPGYGVDAKYYHRILNKKSSVSLKKDHPLKYKDIKKIIKL